MDTFSEKCIEELLCYVYALVDPRDKKIFYIGKGSDDRVFDHSKAALNDDDESLKLNLIREIIDAGYDVEYYIIRHRLTDKEALLVESVLIDFLTYPKFNTEMLLTNIVSGYHQWDEGIKTIDEIATIYDCEKLIADPNDRILLVSLNKTFDRARAKGDTLDLYEITRKHWAISNSRSTKINYVLGVYRGIVRSVIRVTSREWVEEKSRKRCCFSGELLKDSPYLNKTVSDYPFGNGGAIRYIPTEYSKWK